MQVVGQILLKVSIDTCDGYQFRLHGMDEDSGIAVAARTRQCAPAHRCINVDVAVGDKFCTLADGAGND